MNRFQLVFEKVYIFGEFSPIATLVTNIDIISKKIKCSSQVF